MAVHPDLPDALSAAHPCADLQTRAALGSGWPTLHLMIPDARADAAAAQLEARLGPLPQGEILDREDGWAELRVDLPDLDPLHWLQAAAGLPRHSILAPGMRPGAQAARDLGWVAREPLGGGELLAVAEFDPHTALPVRLDLARQPCPDDLAELERELAAAVAEAGGVLESDRGRDRVEAVVHRSTGRYGLRLCAATGSELPLDRVLPALAEVVRYPSRSEPRLAPDVRVERHLGSALVLWLVGQAAPALPGERELQGSTLPPTGLPGELELQLCPRRPEQLPDVVAQVSASAAEIDLRGGPVRWLRHGGRRVFAPSWIGPDSSGLRDLAEALAAQRGVAALRLVLRPPGLEGHWQRIDPAWWRSSGGRCLLRLRDGVRDEDRLPRLYPREPGPAERGLMDRLRGELPGEARAVELPGDHPALLLRGLPRRWRQEAGLGSLMERLDHCVPPEEVPAAILAYRRRTDALLLIQARASRRGRGGRPPGRPSSGV